MLANLVYIEKLSNGAYSGGWYRIQPFRVRIRVHPRKDRGICGYHHVKSIRGFYLYHLGRIPDGYGNCPAFYLDTKELCNDTRRTPSKPVPPLGGF